MKHYLTVIILSLYLSFSAQAADLANGEQINYTCALCHGIYGQGVANEWAPRIAGLSREYVIKALIEYRDSKDRDYTLMSITSGLDNMSEEDMDDIAYYLESMNLKSDARFDVKPTDGDKEEGLKIYNKDCKGCHAEDGYGKPNKEAPPLAGQYPAYLMKTIEAFRSKERVHDNDPEDDSFEDYSMEEMGDVVAHLVSLDNKKITPGFRFSPPGYRYATTKKTPEEKSGIFISDIRQTVVRMAMAEGVTVEDSVAAMITKATELNLKIIGQQNISRDLNAEGFKTPLLRIFQFCNRMDARAMIMQDPIFASYMPCRISMVEDMDGRIWLMMKNLDILMDEELISPEALDVATRVNMQMLSIMVAGISGEF